MKYRQIANSDVSVSEVGFGVWTMATSWWGEHTDADAISTMREARDLGINFFDTAATYGEGRGETLLRDAFPKGERADVVIATKFGYDFANRPKEKLAGHQEAPQQWEVPFIEQSLHEALDRLGTDYIDLWQFHNPRMDALERDELWTFLDRVKREGKVRSIGVALGPAIGWLEEGVYAMEERGADLVQIIYNALELDPGRGLIASAEKSGSSLLVRVPHSSGMLEGKYTLETVFDKSDHRSHRPRAWLENGLKKIEQLDFLVEGESTMAQAALQFLMHTPSIVSALPNIYDRDQLHEFAAASETPSISAEQWGRVEKLYDANFGLAVENEAGIAPENRLASEIKDRDQIRAASE